VSRTGNPYYEIALALEGIRQKICPYSLDDDTQSCGCKFGINSSSSMYSEENGCPELQEMMTFYRRWGEALEQHQNPGTNVAHSTTTNR